MIYNSKYNLVYSGDSASTSRLYDGVAAMTIPILFRIEEFLESVLPFQCIIPWREVVVAIDNLAFNTRPAGAISDAMRFLERNTSWVKRALGLIQYHQPDLLWTHPKSR